MNELKTICVFCGSKEGNDQEITNAAVELGCALAKENIALVYGGSKIGVMGTLAKSVLKEKGVAIGIIPGFLKRKEVVHLGLSELIVTENMHERKLKMHELSDGFIALPGGIGTLEELFEIFTWLQLGLHSKPIGILNCNGFYNDLIELLETMVRKGFVSMINYELLLVDDSVDGLLEKMRLFKAPEIPHWLSEDKT